MSHTMIAVMCCDRCGFEASIAEDEPKAGWGKAYAVETPLDREAFTRRIGTAQQADDLCPGCSDEVFAWWVQVGAVDQPTPPVPVIPTKPVYTLDHRRAAIELVAAAVKLRIDLAIAAVREEPTAMLSGEPIAGAYAEIDATAAGIVDGIADTIGLRRMRL